MRVNEGGKYRRQSGTEVREEKERERDGGRTHTRAHARVSRLPRVGFFGGRVAVVISTKKGRRGKESRCRVGGGMCEGRTMMFLPSLVMTDI